VADLGKQGQGGGGQARRFILFQLQLADVGQHQVVTRHVDVGRMQDEPVTGRRRMAQALHQRAGSGGAGVLGRRRQAEAAGQPVFMGQSARKRIMRWRGAALPRPSSMARAGAGLAQRVARQFSRRQGKGNEDVELIHGALF
jgi:hypothetical protein